MPIDFEAIVAPFRIQFFLQRRTINQVFEDLAKLFKKRKDALEERDRATQNIPTFFFMNEAIEVWLDESQHGALAPAGGSADTSFLEKAAAPFVAFYAGLTGSTKAMIQSEKALPDFLEGLARGVHIIAASIVKFKEPGPALFQVQPNRPASDLAGEVTMLFTLIKDPATANQIFTFVSGSTDMLTTLHSLFPPAPKTDTSESSSLGKLSLQVAGAVLALPLASRLLIDIGPEIPLYALLKLFDIGRQIEIEVADLRASILDFFFVDLLQIGRNLLEWLGETQAFTACSISFYDQVVRDYLGDLKGWFDAISLPLKSYVDTLVDFIYKFVDYLEKVINFDFGFALTGYMLFSFKLADLNDPARLDILLGKVGALDFIIDEVTKGMGRLSKTYRKPRDAIVQLLEGLKTKTADLEAPVPPDLSKLPHFPNIFDAFFGTAALDLPDAAARMAAARANAQALSESFTDMGTKTNANVDTIFNAGIKGLNKAARTFGEAGTEAARLGSQKQYEAVMQRAQELADSVTRPEDFLDKTHPYKDPLAGLMESVFIDTQFGLLTKALPAYVRGMVDFWRKETQKPEEERPTSPHILAKRAQVNRVRVPRITLRIYGTPKLDKSLALETAAHFQQAVADAFRTGFEQYAPSQSEGSAGGK